MQLRITKAGRELAEKLRPSFLALSRAEFHAVQVLCTNICKEAETHHILAVRACNRGLTQRETALNDLTEQRINEFVVCLPMVKNQRITADFQGDPRGATVKLVMPDGRGDSWCGTGRMCVPQ